MLLGMLTLPSWGRIILVAGDMAKVWDDTRPWKCLSEDGVWLLSINSTIFWGRAMPLLSDRIVWLVAPEEML